MTPSTHAIVGMSVLVVGCAPIRVQSTSHEPRAADELPPLPAPSRPVIPDRIAGAGSKPIDPCFRVYDECMRDYGERVPWGDSPNDFDGLLARAAISNVPLSDCYALKQSGHRNHSTRRPRTKP